MPASSTRVLVAEDYAAFRRFLVSTIQSWAGLQVICEVADGLEAVQKAQELQPELILLDIGLPSLNGIEAARRIRHLFPNSKILFVSENRSSDIIEEALSTGALGYVAKSDAARDLFPAVDAVLQGKEFVSASLSVQLDDHRRDQQTNDRLPEAKVAKLPLHNAEIVGDHKVVFYSDDRQLLDELAQFIADALGNGNSAIVIATESHRHSLVRRLQAYGLGVDAAIEQGRYIALDAGNTLSPFIVNGTIDSVQFLESFGTLILKAANATVSGRPRVALFGEYADLLWKGGGLKIVIQDEELGNQLTKRFDLAILCGYSLGNIEGGMQGETFRKICAQHSAVHCP
jgi:DNA-binding NarL/FixJ family response regulator